MQGQLKGDERILQALNRFTFGPKPGDLEAVRQMGLEKWFDQQLNPASIDETDLDARLAQYPAMQWSTQDLIFRLPSPAVIRQAADGKVQIPESGTLHAVYENQIYRYQVKRADKADKQANVAANPEGQGAREQATPGGMDRPQGTPAGSEGASKPGSDGASMDADSGMTASAPAAQIGEKQAGEKEAGEKQAQAGEEQAQPAMAEAGAASPSQDMNAMAPAAAANRNSAQAPVDQPRIQRILALEPEQRVVRLQAMQPEEFEGFIKSLKPAQRAGARQQA